MTSERTDEQWAERLAANYPNPDGWGAHASYTREDWQAEVNEGDTQLGYWSWVLHQLEMVSEDGSLEGAAARAELNALED